MKPSNELPIVDCNDCGACCSQMVHPPFRRLDQSDAEYLRLPADLRDDFLRRMANVTEASIGQPCFWLDPDTKQCGHYEHRPDICRDYPAGGTACLHVRDYFDIEPLD